MFQHILLPTDLSDRSLRAVAAVKDLVPAGEQPRVSLLHVIETVQGADRQELDDFYRDLEQRSRAKLSELAARLADAGLESRQDVVYGKPVSEIVEFAEHHDVDLIVLASHRFDPERPTRGFGTTSYRVGILTGCPVLLMKEPNAA